jgi:hypothetical protein
MARLVAKKTKKQMYSQKIKNKNQIEILFFIFFERRLPTAAASAMPVHGRAWRLGGGCDLAKKRKNKNQILFLFFLANSYRHVSPCLGMASSCLGAERKKQSSRKKVWLLMQTDNNTTQGGD